MIDESPPEVSAREPQGSGKTERPVERQGDADAADQQADSQTFPKGGQGAKEEKATAYDSSQHDRSLSAKKSVLERVVRSEYSAFWTMVATVFLAVGTIGLALATFDMARSTRQLATLAEQQARDTQDALAVSRRQAMAAERANDLSESAQLNVSINPPNAPSANNALLVSFNVFNVGRVPATSIKTNAVLNVLPAPMQPPGLLGACSDCHKSLLFPMQGGQGNNLAFSTSLEAEKITQSVVDSVKSGSSAIYVRARVDFEDAKEHHMIFFCGFYKAKENRYTPCETGNDYKSLPASQWHDVTAVIKKL